MSYKLKPCPFCGSEIQDYPPTFDDEKFPRKSVLGYYVICAACGAQLTQLHKFKNVGVSWNDRPIEDALLARAEKAEAMVEQLIEAGEFLAESYEEQWNEDDEHPTAWRWNNLVSEWDCRNDKQEEE